MIKEEEKELTEEELKEQEDQFFINAVDPGSMQRIPRGGEFLEPGHPETLYNDKSAEEEIIKQTRERFQECAQVAALGNSPGLQLILKRIDVMSKALHADNENMMRDKERAIDTGLMQSNIFGSAQLQDLKAWILGQQETYLREIAEKPEEE